MWSTIYEGCSFVKKNPKHVVLASWSAPVLPLVTPCLISCDGNSVQHENEMAAQGQVWGMFVSARCWTYDNIINLLTPRVLLSAAPLGFSLPARVPACFSLKVEVRQRDCTPPVRLREINSAGESDRVERRTIHLGSTACHAKDRERWAIVWGWEGVAIRRCRVTYWNDTIHLIRDSTVQWTNNPTGVPPQSLTRFSQKEEVWAFILTLTMEN